MEIYKYAPNGIITRTWCVATEHSMSLFVNLNSKRYFSNHHTVSGSESFIVVFETQDSVGDDTIILKPESEREKIFIRNIRFELRAGFQLWFLLVDDDIYNSDKEISTTHEIETLAEFLKIRNAGC